MSYQGLYPALELSCALTEDVNVVDEPGEACYENATADLDKSLHVIVTLVAIAPGA